MLTGSYACCAKKPLIITTVRSRTAPPGNLQPPTATAVVAVSPLTVEFRAYTDYHPWPGATPYTDDSLRPRKSFHAAVLQYNNMVKRVFNRVRYKPRVVLL